MKTKVLKVKEDVLELEDSPFRKAGGGQPCDFGTITSEDFEAEVIDVISDNEVKVKATKNMPMENVDVIVKIDENRRNVLTRMHTGEHMFFKSLEKEIPTLKLSKIRLDEKESLLVVYADSLSWEQVFKAEENVNKLIKENLEVIEHNAKRSEVKEKFPKLRIKLDRIKSDTVRVIEVKDFDFSACSGTHCKTTGEVKGFLVTKFNSSGPTKFEIRFKVDVEDDLHELSKVARKTSSILGAEPGKVESTLTNLKDNFEKFKKMARDVKVEAKTEVVEGINFLYNVVELEKKSLMNQMKDFLKENTIVCFINKTEKGAMILISVADGLSSDAALILKKTMEKFGGRGGGKKNFAMGSIETDKFDEVFNYIKKMIK